MERLTIEMEAIWTGASWRHAPQPVVPAPQPPTRRTPPRGVSAEDRVLAVLDTERGIPQRMVIALAAMDCQTCIRTLMLLEYLGKVTREIAKTGKQGRPAYLYRKVA